METSRLFIISGPSCAGEDSIIDGLSGRLPVERVITTTTRELRPGETQGKPYYFISRSEFDEKRAAGEFLEWAEEYNGQFYGVTREELERVVSSGKIGIWKIEWKGVVTAKRLFPDIVAILVTAPLESIQSRLYKRDSLTDAYFTERMAYTREWMNHTDIYDYTIENLDGRLEEAVAETERIIREHADLSNGR